MASQLSRRFLRITIFFVILAMIAVSVHSRAMSSQRIEFHRLLSTYQEAALANDSRLLLSITAPRARAVASEWLRLAREGSASAVKSMPVDDMMMILVLRAEYRAIELASVSAHDALRTRFELGSKNLRHAHQVEDAETSGSDVIVTLRRENEGGSSTMIGPSKFFERDGERWAFDWTLLSPLILIKPTSGLTPEDRARGVEAAVLQMFPELNAAELWRGPRP